MKIKICSAAQLLTISVFVLMLLCPATTRAAGAVDTSFHAYLAKVGAGSVYRTAIQSDGKIIITGTFRMIDGVPRANIARLNADGSLDTTFNPPSVITGLEYIKIHAIGLQSNGKIIIGGPFQQFDGVWRQGIARLNQDGSLDTFFNSNTSLDTLALAYDLKVTPDDKIVFAGIRTGNVNVITRLNADGSLDAETTQSAYRIEVQPDGKVLYFSSGQGLRRLNQNLTPDNTFAQVTTNNTVYMIKAQPDGKILLAGIFTMINGTGAPGVVRVNSDGSVDVPFTSNKTGTSNALAVLYLPSGKILVPNGGTLLLRSSDGTLDPSFNASTNLESINDLKLQSDGKIIAAGAGNGVNSLVVRLNADGTIDNSFNSSIGDFAFGKKVLVQKDNKILVSGDFNYVSGVSRHHLIRFNADGTTDTSFNQNVFNDSPVLVDIFPDGKIAAAYGTAVRLNPDGTQDITYPGSFNARDIKALPDGKLLVAKNGSIERYNVNGTLDNTFNVSTAGDNFKIVIQPDGKILIGGSFTHVNGIARSRIARLNADGTLDTTFNSPAGGINGAVPYIELLSGGKIVIGGNFSGISFNTRQGLARLNADGSLDLGFVPPPSFSLDFVKVQPDGKVLLGGPSATRPIWRLNADGSLDTSFTVTASNFSENAPRGRSADLQSDGKIILVGEFDKVNGVSALGIVRLLNPSRVPFDFDGDGKADISIFRPSSGEWWYYRSSDGGNYAAQFGASSDRLVPGDFTGDGRTDIAVWRPASGEWFILRSEDGSYYSYPFGTNGDIPSVGDFDGDGRADSAVFRPSDTNWYIRRSSDGGFTIQQFGANGDVPAVGDYDGDGKSDIAIWRASTGEWWIRKSSDSSVVAFQFGNSADKPVQGDYTGDGKADVAIYRPSTGEWFILRSDDFSYYSFPFGTTGDIPAAGDYDGDGRFDATVFRPSASTWYVQRSTAGTLIQNFGISGDKPVPNVFVP